MSKKRDTDKELIELPLEGVNDWVSRSELEITEKTVLKNLRSIEEIKSPKPEVVTEVPSEPRKRYMWIIYC